MSNTSQSPVIPSWLEEDEIAFRQFADSIIKNLANYSPNINEYEFKHYFSSGVSSLVALVVVNGEQRILKTSRWGNNIQREVMFMNYWEEVGVPVVKTSEIIKVESGEFGTMNLAVTEFIDHPTGIQLLDGKPNEEHLETWQVIGEYLAKMHQVTASGFGKPVGDDFKRGKYNSFQGYVSEQLFKQKDRDILQKVNADAISKIDLVSDLLSAQGLPSIVTHHDLGIHNVLGSGKDLVVFDPDPTIDLAYIDLSVSYVWALGQSGKQNADELVLAYMSKLTEMNQHWFNQEVFEAALWLVLVSKQSKWMKWAETDTHYVELIEGLQPLIQRIQSQL